MRKLNIACGTPRKSRQNNRRKMFTFVRKAKRSTHLKNCHIVRIKKAPGTSTKYMHRTQETYKREHHMYAPENSRSGNALTSPPKRPILNFNF